MKKRFFHSELRGMRVVGANGRSFGDVDDLDVDVESWRIASVIVRVSSTAVVDLGLEKPFWTHARLTIPVDHISGASDSLVLRTTLEEFAQLLAVAKADES